MCGIAGFTGMLEARREIISRMMDRIVHRGPDMSGDYLGEGITLGFRRLSIIDLSEAGRQPMTSSDGRYTVIFNGEIYNYRDIKAQLSARGHTFHSETDTEALLHAYMEYGREMLDRLLEKAPEAQAVLCDLEAYQPTERFDYIFIPSGSVSLFTDMETCKDILRKMKTLLKAGGRFVFAVDTTATRCPDSDVYTESVSVETAEKHRLVLKSKSRYDEATRTQFNPSLYELYDGGVLLRREEMDFQIHLYEPGEMDGMLKAIGFTVDAVYTGFSKETGDPAASEILIYECTRGQV